MRGPARILLPLVVLGALALRGTPAGAGARVEARGGVALPALSFMMGRDDGPPEEAPRHRVRLRGFRIDRTETTVAAYASQMRKTQGWAQIEGSPTRDSLELALDALRALEATHGGQLAKQPPLAAGGPDRATRRRWGALAAIVHVRTGTDPAREGVEGVPEAILRPLLLAEAQRPVRFVTWRDAQAFCHARGGRLPTEAEWERAARGRGGRAYPFGATFESGRCATGRGAKEGPAPVTEHPRCVTPEGILGLAGNVWEWTADWYDDRYYHHSPVFDPRGPKGLADAQLPAADPGVSRLRGAAAGRETDTRKVIRGGGFAAVSQAHARHDLRATRRLPLPPDAAHPDVGFRCVYPREPHARRAGSGPRRLQASGASRR